MSTYSELVYEAAAGLIKDIAERRGFDPGLLEGEEFRKSVRDAFDMLAAKGGKKDD